MDLNGIAKEFVEQHKSQLEKSDVPIHFWPTLFKKLYGDSVSLYLHVKERF